MNVTAGAWQALDTRMRYKLLLAVATYQKLARTGGRASDRG